MNLVFIYSALPSLSAGPVRLSLSRAERRIALKIYFRQFSRIKFTFLSSSAVPAMHKAARRTHTATRDARAHRGAAPHIDSRQSENEIKIKIETIKIV